MIARSMTSGLMAALVCAALPAFAQAGAAPRGLRPVADGATRQVISLDDATARAVEESIDLRIASAKLDEANARVRQAWSYVLPNVSLGAEYNYNFPEQTVAFGDEEQFKQQALLYASLADITEGSAAQNPDPVARRAAVERAAQLRQVAKQLENSEVQEIVVQPAHVLNGQLQFSMPIFSGRALPLLQNAYTGVDLTRLGAKQARASIGFATAQIYYQVVASQRIVEIAKGQRESAVRHLEVSKQREEAGFLTELQRQRAELDLARAEQQQKAAENGLRAAKAALGNLIGQEEDFDVAEPGTLGAPTVGSPEELIVRATSGRTDVRMQRAALSIADRNKVDAWMRFMPSLRFVASGRYTTNTSGFVSEPFTGVLGVQANLPIFDGGLAVGAVEEANAQARQEILRARQLEQQVEQEVRGALDDLALKAEAKETAEHVAVLAKSQHENAERLFENGLATNLDVADARLGAFASEVDAARARFDLEIAKLALLKALGELEPAPDKSPRDLEDAEVDRARAFVDKAAE
jgi:outer membrane protein